VALTRARQTLVISSIAPYRPNVRSWWQRLVETELLDDLSIEAAPPAAAADTAAPERHPFCLKTLPAAPSDNQAAATVDDLDPLAARIGKAMHRLLEWGQRSSRHKVAVAREFALTPEQAGMAVDMAGRILTGAGAWAWDPAVLAWSGNEVGLLYQGGFRQIDRLVQRRDGAHAGEWWVLDYKSAQSPQEQTELLAQLHGYRSAVRALYPDAVVRAAFLTAQGKLIELENGV